jgi:enoyl reductase-like protein
MFSTCKIKGEEDSNFAHSIDQRLTHYLKEDMIAGNLTQPKSSDVFEIHQIVFTEVIDRINNPLSNLLVKIKNAYDIRIRDIEKGTINRGRSTS